MFNTGSVKSVMCVGDDSASFFVVQSSSRWERLGNKSVFERTVLAVQVTVLINKRLAFRADTDSNRIDHCLKCRYEKRDPIIEGVVDINDDQINALMIFPHDRLINQSVASGLRS